MKIELEQNEIEFILNVLGELPTKSNAFVVVQKIQQQLAPAGEQVTEQQPE
jgi:predicted nuclease of restriction endonuclease-like (RecB) superfamily